MNLLEVSVLTSHEAVDAISSELMDLGASGIQINDQNDYDPELQEDLENAKVSAYFQEGTDIKNVVDKVSDKVKHLPEFGLKQGKAKVSYRDVSSDEWETAWEKYYQPLRITRFLTVVPNWEDYVPKDSDEMMIKLDPGMAFGTGTHPTTQLAMQALEIVLRGGEKLFDVGTGSAVLSIAAKKLGAGAISAWDYDDVAVESAKKNLELNPDVKGIKVGTNNLLDGINEKADVIVANMLPVVLLPMIPQAKDCMENGGKLILSGIIADKLEVIKKALADNSFKIKQVLTMDDWRSIIAVKDSEE